MKRLRGDAALPRVGQAARGTNAGGEVEVGIGQDHVGVAPAEFEDRWFEVLAGGLRQPTCRPLRSR